MCCLQAAICICLPAYRAWIPDVYKRQVYKMPDYASVHKELQRSGVTLNLLWLEYLSLIHI